MALDDLLEESSSTLAWEQLFFDPSLYPAADEQIRDDGGLHSFSRSETTVPFVRYACLPPLVLFHHHRSTGRGILR